MERRRLLASNPILFNQPPGGGYSEPSSNFYSPIVTDLDGDPFPDLVVGVERANGAGSYVLLLRGDGHGKLTLSAQVNVPYAYTLATGDMNHDGFTDVVAGGFRDGRLATVLGDGKGGVLNTVLQDSTLARTNVAIGYLDEDAREDVVVTSDATLSGFSGPTRVGLGRNNGTFDYSEGVGDATLPPLHPGVRRPGGPEPRRPPRPDPRGVGCARHYHRSRAG